MWTCPKCHRKFKSTNQHHVCTTKDIGELFIDKSDELVLAFDRVMTEVMDWEPNHMGPAKNSIVFTNRKAWLIIKPMKNVLDLKFYHREKIESDLVIRCSKYPNKFAHHLRVTSEHEITSELLDLLHRGYLYAME